MVLLPGDNDKGADGTSRKPPLYVTVKVIKFLLDHPNLCINERKTGGYMKIQLYHPNANEDVVADGVELLVTELGAWCPYPDATQAELGLYPFADQTRSPFMVVIGLGMVMHHTQVFCTRSLCRQMTN